MKKIALIATIALIGMGCASTQTPPDSQIFTPRAEGPTQPAAKPPVFSGLDVLEAQNFAPLHGKRVGLVTNATGVNRRLHSVIDLLHNSEKVELVALYGPEHGVRGDIPAGEYVRTYVDDRTGVTVFSIYGETRKPTPDMLENVDILLYDIQDVGSRSYTYISSMGLAMEAAAEKGIPFMVLDRPNPLGGKIEGNLTEEGFYSFVSQFEIPYAYGMTSGELAIFLNEEGMLTDSAKVDLTVIPMQNWHRRMSFPDTGLPWVPTSPHIPHTHTAIFYTATGILGELQVISEGVGYTMPFEVFGAPWIDSGALADRLNALKVPGVVFRPITWRQFYGRNEGETMHGVQVHIFDYTQVNLMSLQYLFMQEHHVLYPDKNPFKLATEARIRMFDRVSGSDQPRILFTERMRFEDVKPYLNKDVESFRERSSKYYLYP